MKAVQPSSLCSLIGRVEDAINQGRINLALSIIHDFVELAITEPLCTSQVYGSRDLDELCQRIGVHNLSNLKMGPADLLPFESGRSRIIYIVSRLQRSGGHFRLLQDFIHAQPDKEHLIISTGVGGPSDESYISNVFYNNKNVRFISAPRTNFQSRLSWLQSKLVSSQPEHVHLFNHHQDSVAVAALVPEIGLDGSFNHHGDHHLCLGVNVSHLRHVDFHPMGYHHCRNKLRIDNLYLPLTFEDKHFLPMESRPLAGGCLTTSTAARFNKVEIPYYVSYLDLIPQILSSTGGRHIHIGRLTRRGLKRIYKNLDQLGVPRDRFVYVEWVPSVWEAMQKFQVDVYLASFPYGAGLTLIEVMGAGIPVILHQHIYSRVLSGIELAYPQAYRWADPEKLIAHLATLSPGILRSESLLAREQYLAFHRPEILCDYLKHEKLDNLCVTGLNPDFNPRWDEWAAWVVSQQNVFSMVYRKAHRAWRKIRRILS